MRSAVREPAPGERRNSAAERAAKMAAAAAAAAMAVPPVTMINAASLLEVIAPMGMANRPSEDEVNQMYTLLLQDSSQEKERKDIPLGARRQPLGLSVFQIDKALRTAGRNLSQARQGSCMLL